MTTEAPPPSQSDNSLAEVERQRLLFDQEKHARDRWHHEDHLVNQRTTWLIQTQGVLGAAFGYLQYRVADVNAGLVSGLGSPQKENYIATLGQFSRGIQVLGFLTSASLLAGIFAANIAQSVLQRQHPNAILGVAPSTTMLGHGAGLTIPLASLAAWIFSYVLIH